ncbi:MAG: hypothetical protein GEU96_20335 [Propionibacteriales bacterium]|nr:hypothetical protein [Propionibacteriales bacterium]
MVYVGTMKVGWTEQNEFGHLEVHLGDPDFADQYRHSWPRNQREDHPEEEPPEPKRRLVYYAVCSAWTHPNDTPSVNKGAWYGPDRETYEAAEADAAEHEHPTAHVSQYAPG